MLGILGQPQLEAPVVWIARWDLAILGRLDEWLD